MKMFYAYTEEEKMHLLENNGPDTKVNIQRYKGLGEMN